MILPGMTAPRFVEKDLKYWQERGGQIEWRLAAAKMDVIAFERDLKECDENIKRLKDHATRER